MQTKTKTMKEVMQEKWIKRPLIIGGPCSAETEEQVLETATRLAKTGKIDVLRAGIWKPRTKPGMFEGIGVKGLPWLLQAKKITGLPVTVEVATAKHVEDAVQQLFLVQVEQLLFALLEQLPHEVGGVESFEERRKRLNGNRVRPERRDFDAELHQQRLNLLEQRDLPGAGRERCRDE